MKVMTNLTLASLASLYVTALATALLFISPAASLRFILNTFRPILSSFPYNSVPTSRSPAL